MIVIHCDGSITADRTKAKYGFIIRDGDSVVHGSGVVPEQWGNTTNVGEYFAVLMALWKLREGGVPTDEVVVKSDSQLVIYQLTGRYQVLKDHLRKLNEQIRLACRGWDIRFEWIPREQNKEADALAGRPQEETP